ncbi:MAG: 3-hydroxyacyl-ACP dehydratase [Ferruginibacter sp.]
MLLNDFFNITELTNDGTNVNAELTLNVFHPIFTGHFPGQPVVPGVCMMQMVKELVESVTGKITDLSIAHEMKFLVIIDPNKNNRVNAVLKYTVDGNKVNVVASLQNEQTIHFKFKGQFDFQ